MKRELIFFVIYVSDIFHQVSTRYFDSLLSNVLAPFSSEIILVNQISTKHFFCFDLATQTGEIYASSPELLRDVFSSKYCSRCLVVESI